MKTKTIHLCSECGYQTPKWLGRCPECGAWHTLTEQLLAKGASPSVTIPGAAPIPLSAVDQTDFKRLSTGLREFDRVLGGGIVPGAVILLGGDPGIGKSTLLLQAMASLSAAHGTTVLYVSGEESLQQIKLRADRLGIEGHQIHMLGETRWEAVHHALEQLRPAVLVLDSIQTISTDAVDSAPGSITQVRAVTGELTRWAKAENVPVVVVGHVTKDGNVAGPKTLEHMVDAVMYVEGRKETGYRILRAAKNRYGSTEEIGVLAMTEKGLQTVENPSMVLLAERPTGVSGSVVASAHEGTRPLLVEIQALITDNYSGGPPRRTVQGMDKNRVALISAIADKKLGIPLGNNDVYVNLVGGLRLTEPGLDLPLIAAMISSYRDQPLPKAVALFGEVGLAGEVRSVGHTAARIREAAEMGYERCIVPSHGLKNEIPGNIDVCGIRHVRELAHVLFQRES